MCSFLVFLGEKAAIDCLVHKGAKSANPRKAAGFVPGLRTFNLGSFIAAPPYFTTTVFPRNCCRYGKASDSTDTLSNEVKLEVCK